MAVLERGKDYELREAQADDIAFIRSTWLRDYRERSSLARRIDDAEYQFFHRLLVDRIASRSSTVVAFDLAAPNVLWGFCCWEPGTLHYVYVKRPFRNMRLAAGMLEAAGLQPDWFYTHLTYPWESVVRQKHQGLRFSPYRI